MKQVITHIAIATIISLMAGLEVYAQNTSSAVMEIRVEVVSGASIERNDANQTFALINEELAYAEFSMTLPEGAEVITSSGDRVEMLNGTQSWAMNSKMNVEQDVNGKMNFRFTTNGNDKAQEGFHKGVQIATIEYL